MKSLVLAGIAAGAMHAPWERPLLCPGGGRVPETASGQRDLQRREPGYACRLAG